LTDVKKLKLDEKKFKLSCIVEGDNIKKYDVKSQVKAITYNDMSIKKIKKRYEAVVVVDI